MYIVGYFLQAVATVLNMVLWLYMWIIIARAVLSWVSPDPYNPIVRFIHNVTEPVLYRIRSKFPISFGGIDLSPLFAIMLIYFLQRFVIQSIARFAHSLI